MKLMSELTYCSDWYNLNVNEKKLFLQLLQQSQIKVNINAYGLVELNLQTYGAVFFFNPFFLFIEIIY